MRRTYNPHINPLEGALTMAHMGRSSKLISLRRELLGLWLVGFQVPSYSGSGKNQAAWAMRGLPGLARRDYITCCCPCAGMG